MKDAVSPDEDNKHERAVTSLAFSPDGKTIASASEDKKVKLWKRV